MKIIKSVQVMGHDFSVRVVRNKALAGGGMADWNKGIIELYRDNDTSDKTLLATLFHECDEMLSVGRNERFMGPVDNIIFVSEHETINYRADLFLNIMAATLQANGLTLDGLSIISWR